MKSSWYAATAYRDRRARVSRSIGSLVDQTAAAYMFKLESDWCNAPQHWERTAHQRVSIVVTKPPSKKTMPVTHRSAKSLMPGTKLAASELAESMWTW
jgi:hypothetical protein